MRDSKFIESRNNLSEEFWEAILSNDASYDGTFYYGVRTTGIYCRPSCKSKPPNRNNVLIFLESSKALTEQFRPCKRCKPDGKQIPDDAWIGQISEWIDRSYSEHITLSVLASLFHSSPFHLQRTFKRVKGLTPAAYVQQIRIAQAKQLLNTTHLPVWTIAKAVGIPNAAHFTTLFQQKTSLTPTEFRHLKPDGGVKSE